MREIVQYRGGAYRKGATEDLAFQPRPLLSGDEARILLKRKLFQIPTISINESNRIANGSQAAD